MTVGLYFSSLIKDLTECVVPEKLQNHIGMFLRVAVKIQDETLTGIVVAIHEKGSDKDPEKMMPVSRVIDREPVISQEQYELSARVAEHYLANRSDVIFSMIPSGKKEAAASELEEAPPVELPPLTPDQKVIFEKIIGAGLGKPRIHLIHGITGSGKTRIYIELIREYLKRRLGVIFLVPEIALSYQFLKTLRPVFGSQMALLHSGLSRSFRFSEYKRVLKDEARLVIGTRSAVFAPVRDLGLVIVDEEHDGSYKEHTSSRYNAKWVAADRLRHHPDWPFKLPLSMVLGSATPAIETMYFARNGVFELHTLKKRATGQALPDIHIPLHQLADDGADIFSPFLVKKMEEHFSKGNQAILILNRRGYSNCAFCPGCEANVMCPHCSVSLTHHRENSGNNILKCHLCGYHEDYRGICGHCGAKLRLLGKGIQKVEDALEFHFPEKVYARMDQDSVGTKGYTEDVLGAMLSRKIDILVGTQMVTKGFDLPGVTLVGLLNADIGLSLPDFRAAERVFQLLVQASGRAGRHSGGEVVMQTMQPHHYAIEAAKNADYDSFYFQEIGMREKMNYPPFCRLLRILLRGKNEENLWHYANRLKLHIQEVYSKNSLFEDKTAAEFPDEVLGPVDAPLYKINNEFRVHLLIKDKSPDKLREFGRNVRTYYHTHRRNYQEIRAEFDLDPMDVL